MRRFDDDDKSSGRSPDQRPGATRRARTAKEVPGFVAILRIPGPAVIVRLRNMNATLPLRSPAGVGAKTC